MGPYSTYIVTAYAVFLSVTIGMAIYYLRVWHYCRDPLTKDPLTKEHLSRDPLTKDPLSRESLCKVPHDRHLVEDKHLGEDKRRRDLL